VNGFLSGLGFKYPAILGVGLFLSYLALKRRPSIHGWLAALFCLYLPASSKFPFAFAFGLNLLNLFYFLLLLAGWGRERVSGKDPVRTTAVIWVGICLLSFIIGSFTGTAYALSDRINLLKRWLDPVIVYALMRQLSTDSDRRAAIDGIVIGTILFSVHLSLQGLDLGHKERVGGLMDQANDAGAFVAGYAPVLVAVLASTTSAAKRLLLIGGLAVCAFAEFQTVSRSGFIGLGIGLFVASVFSRSWFTRALMFGLLVVGIVSPSLLPEKVVSRFAGHDIQGSQESDEAAVSMAGRYEIWNAGLAMGLSNPLGVGLGEFSNRIGRYGGPEQRDAHNLYLLVWTEMGIAGAVVLVALMVQLLLRGLAGCSVNDPISRLAGIGLTGAVCALVVTNLFSVSLRDVAVFGYAMILAAVIRRDASPDASTST